MKKDEIYCWNDRTKRYESHSMDVLFKRGDGALRFHHYKCAIVVSGVGNVWLYTDKDFDQLIAVIEKARKAALQPPHLKAKNESDALDELKKHRAARKHRKTTTKPRKEG